MTASKEKEFLKKLLYDHGISATISEETDVGWFTITFTKRKDRGTFKKILSEKRIDFAEEGKTALFVLVAFPDILLEEERDGETEDQKKMRLINEYEQRLLLIFKMMNFTVHNLIGPKHKGENHVSISGNNGKRRIDFCGPKNKEFTEPILVKAGFHCSPPPNGEKHTLIVDLEASKHGVLVQEIEELITLKRISITEKKEKMAEEKTVEVEKKTFSEIKAFLVSNGYKLGTTNTRPSDKGRGQFFDSNEIASRAHLDIKNEFGIITDVRGRAIYFSKNDLIPSPRGGGKKKEKLEETETKIWSPKEILAELHKMLTEKSSKKEIALLKTENRELKETIKTLKTELEDLKTKVAAFKRAFE